MVQYSITNFPKTQKKHLQFLNLKRHITVFVLRNRHHETGLGYNLTHIHQCWATAKTFAQLSKPSYF